ncbi:MAG: hypothetical protein LC648_03235 [Novosphingobium sp.]|nr:hypothetical protein [Novosphingobium sp.]
MILGDRRRPGLPGELVGRLVLIWLGVAILQGLGVAIGIWLAPAGAAAAVTPGLAALGQAVALGCVMVLLGRLAYRFFDVETAGLACLVSALALPLMAALRPLEANPLAWQAVALLLALNGLMARDPRAGGWTIGAALALWLAISAQGAVLALGLLALVAGKWLENRAQRGWLVHALQALTVGAGAVVVGQWAFGIVPACGSLGLAHLAAVAWAAAVVTVMAAIEPHPRAFTLLGFSAAIGGAITLLTWLAPGCTAGATLGFAEARPLWAENPVFVLQAIGLPLVALFTQARLYARASAWLRRWWADYFLLTLLATILAVIDGRAAPAACALAAVPLGWQIREWTRAARNSRRSGRRAFALAGVALACAPALPLALVLTATPSVAEELSR